MIRPTNRFDLAEYVRNHPASLIHPFIHLAENDLKENVGIKQKLFAGSILFKPLEPVADRYWCPKTKQLDFRLG